MKPLVSVVTPAYNCAAYLRQAITSVGNQDYPNWEHIIIDDCSTDITKDIIIEAQQRDCRIKPIFLDKNSGVAKARNEGISAAQGKYISFLDSDDLWEKNKLSVQVEFMEEKQIDFSYSNYRIIDEDGIFLKDIISKKDRTDYKCLLNSNKIGCLTVMISAQIMKAHLMPYIRHEDYAAWLTILRDEIKYAYRINAILASYRRSHNSVSANKIRTVSWVWNVFRNNQKLSFLRSFMQVFIFELITIKKYL